MGWITKRYGNGIWGTVDADFPDNPPSVSFNGTITTNPELTQSFARIMNDQFRDNEEVRIDNLDNSFSYVGVAPSGSSIDDPIWSCIRATLINNSKVRLQFRNNISWTNRFNGWL